MSTLSQFTGQKIKSIQRGVLTMTSSSLTATISSVDTSKSILYFLGNTAYNSTSGTGDIYIELLDSTTIRGTRSTPTGGTATLVSYQVVEYT